MKMKVLVFTCLFFGLTAMVRAGEFGLALLMGATDVKVEWDLNADHDTTGYRVYRSDVSGSYDQSKIVGMADSASTAYTDTAVPDGTWYWVVTAIDGVGNESEASNEITRTLDTIPPPVPQNLRFAP